MLLEKDVGFLNETKLDVAFNYMDLAQAENVCLNVLIVKLFTESEEIKNLVNYGSTDKTYNLGWSNGFKTGDKFPSRFDANHPYVPLKRPLQKIYKVTLVDYTS